MTKANKFNLILVSMLTILLLCNVTIAKPTLSFSNETQADQDAVQQVSDQERFLLGSTLKLEMSYSPASSGLPAPALYTEGLPSLNLPRGYWSSRGKTKYPSISKWCFSRKIIDEDFTKPAFFTSSPTTRQGSVQPGTFTSGSAVVPAPAAVSLGCMGLAIVGWLRNRKTV